jgi:hypothetical protein
MVRLAPTGHSLRDGGFVDVDHDHLSAAFRKGL